MSQFSVLISPQCPMGPMTLCNLGVGATFGESVLSDMPRDSTVVTKTSVELLRVEQQDFRLIFEVSAGEIRGRFLVKLILTVNLNFKFSPFSIRYVCARVNLMKYITFIYRTEKQGSDERRHHQQQI